MDGATMIHTYATEAEWHEARRNWIGASEVAIIIGESPWGSPVEVWAQKCGLMDPTEGNEAMRWGNRLQRAVAEAYAEDTGRVVETAPAGKWEIISHPEAPMHASLDGTVYREEDADGVDPGVLEIKCVGAHNAGDWMDGPPRHYWLQIQAQMACSGYSWGSFAVLVGGQRLLWQDVERDDEAIAELERACSDWWEAYVIPREQPPAATKADTQAIAAMAGEGREVKRAPTKVDHLVHWYREAKATADAWVAKAEKEKAAIIAAIQAEQAGGLQGPDYTVTWIPNRNGVRSFKLTRRDSK